MSIIENVVRIATWVGPTCYQKTLCVTVLSSNMDITEKICAALTEVHTKGNWHWKLMVMKSFLLEDVNTQSNVTGRPAIDFVVVAMDTSKMVCLDWTKKAVCQVHPDLRMRRTVLVNASGLPINSMAVNPDELISLQTDLKMDMLTANVFKPDDAVFLARRLLKYMEVSIGLNTGIPNLNV